VLVQLVTPNSPASALSVGDTFAKKGQVFATWPFFLCIAFCRIAPIPVRPFFTSQSHDETHGKILRAVIASDRTGCADAICAS
jgi:hypothetical protein